MEAEVPASQARHEIVIEEFQPAVAIPRFVPTPHTTGVQTKAPAAALSVVLHAALACALLFVGERTYPTRDLLPGVAATASGYSIEPLVVVLIDENTASATKLIDIPSLSALHLAAIQPLSIPDLDVSTPDIGEVDSPMESADAAEPTAVKGLDRAELFRRYLSQISARIERAWEHRPGNSNRPCRVEIQQDTAGRVLDVKFTACESDEATRAALLNAIRRAAPLPAPPVAQVFAERVTLDFAATR